MKKKTPAPKTSLIEVLADRRKRALLDNYVDEIMKNKLVIAEAQDAIKTLKASAIETLNLDASVLNKFITALVEGDDSSNAEVAAAMNAFGAN